MSKEADTTRPGRVLIVDDNPINRDLLVQELEDEGFEVFEAASGQECLEVTQMRAPEVILLDIHMPQMDGIETCRRLKVDSEAKHIPVVFVTANQDESTTVEALEAGGSDFLSKPFSQPILIARVRCQIASYRAHTELRRLAMTDELTGVFSRRYLFSAMRQAVKTLTRRGPSTLACLVVDVDHFKQVNDTRGHLEGDRVLREVAASIRRSLRETDIVARFGGEEFVAVLPMTDLEGARMSAEKVRANIAADCEPVTASVGVASLADISAERVRGDVNALVEDLLRRSDTAMYAAKQRGRNCVVTEPARTAAKASGGDAS